MSDPHHPEHRSSAADPSSWAGQPTVDPPAESGPPSSLSLFERSGTPRGSHESAGSQETPGSYDKPASRVPPSGRTDGGPSRRRLIGLGITALLGLSGAVAIGGYGWRIAAQQDPVLETPAQLAGLTRDDSERAQETVDYLRSGFAADIALDRSIGAAYADPATAGRDVLLFGGATRLWQPERDLDKLFELLTDGSGKITGLREVPAGELGGVMKCGAISAADGDLTVCGWADHGSVVMAMFPGRNAEEAAVLFRDMRGGVQRRE